MSYDELLPWRSLAQRISKDVLSPTHRLIIITLITYESSARGAYFSPEKIAAELGLSYRAVLDNLHYLGSGLVWKKGVRSPCVNPNCKAHLGIVQTSHYARSKKAQVYRVNINALELLASMHPSSPTEVSMNSKTSLDAPESGVHEPKGDLARAPVHAYKHNKHFINDYKLTNVSKINYERFNYVIGDLPEDVKQYVKAGSNYEKLLDKCESNGMPRSEIRTAVGKVNYSNAYKIGGLLNDVLQGLADVRRHRTSSSLPHCGSDYCDVVTRTFPEPSEINGRLENRCPKCNDQLVKEIERRKASEPFEWNSFLKSLDDV